MEGITEIDKTEYIDECKEIVRNEISEELSDEMLTIVTNEIMDTCLFIGGDFKKETSGLFDFSWFYGTKNRNKVFLCSIIPYVRIKRNSIISF